jgi:Zn-dependent M28 family amino/carboxypeptidase
MGKLQEEGWNPTPDEGEYQGVAVRNIFGRKGQGPVIIVGTHFDSRKCADQPEGGCAEPVLGANDGASGVAVLLELAYVLEESRLQNQIWLVFFDAEDDGRIGGWDWIVGSRQFARYVEEDISRGTQFQAMILLDMVGDSDQQFYWEGNSDPALREAIWSAAKNLGYGKEFIPELRHTVLDDHIPFRDLGIPSADIIDFDYPYWHTAEDTLDKTSAASLERVGRTVEVWLESG